MTLLGALVINPCGFCLCHVARAWARLSACAGTESRGMSVDWPFWVPVRLVAFTQLFWPFGISDRGLAPRYPDFRRGRRNGVRAFQIQIVRGAKIVNDLLSSLPFRKGRKVPIG